MTTFLLFAMYLAFLSSILSDNIEDVKIFGHRGGIRGLVPESSLLSFSIGAQMNADYLECDIGSTSDGELIVIHDIILDHMTDINDHPEFADQKQTFNFSCREQNPHTPSRYGCYNNIDAYYVFNFTLQQLKTLKLRARDIYNNDYNPLNDQFQILSFREFLYLVNNLSVALNRSIGITPEVKSAFIFREVGLEMEHKYMELLYETGFVDKSDGYYKTNYFMKNNVSMPTLIVQSDSYTSLSIIGNLSRNIYESENVHENVPLQFGIYASDAIDWKLVNWANTFSNGLNIPWTMVNEYYDLIRNNPNISINIHFRLEDFVPGTFQYDDQYIRNQYFTALNYRILYGMDAIFSDNVESLNSLISMLSEFSNSSSLLYAEKDTLLDIDAIIDGLGIKVNDGDNDSWRIWSGLFVGMVVIWIVTVIVFIWMYRKKGKSQNSFRSLATEAANLKT